MLYEVEEDEENNPIIGSFISCPDLAGAGLLTTPKELLKIAKEFMLSLNRFFEPIMKRAGVEQAFKNLALTDAETRLAIANGDVANEEKQNKAEERLLTIAKRNLSQKDFERLDQFFQV